MMPSLQDIRNINDPQHKDYQVIHMALASYDKYPPCFSPKISSHFCWGLETTWGLLQTLVNLEVKMSDYLMLFWTSFIIFLLLWERKTKDFNLIYLSCPISWVQFFCLKPRAVRELKILPVDLTTCDEVAILQWHHQTSIFQFDPDL